MPRNDRWRPSQVHRMVTPEARAEAQRRRDATERAGSLAATARADLGRFVIRAQLVTCNHGVPWTICTLCSKPAAP